MALILTGCTKVYVPAPAVNPLPAPPKAPEKVVPMPPPKPVREGQPPLHKGYETDTARLGEVVNRVDQEWLLYIYVNPEFEGDRAVGEPMLVISRGLSGEMLVPS